MEKNMTQKTKIKSNAKYWVSVVAIGVVLGFSLQLVSAGWWNPTEPAPGGDVQAPITTGFVEQLKAGPLGIGGLLKAYSDLIVNGKIDSVGDVCTQMGGGICLSAMASGGGCVNGTQKVAESSDASFSASNAQAIKDYIKNRKGIITGASCSNTASSNCSGIPYPGCVDKDFGQIISFNSVMANASDSGFTMYGADFNSVPFQCNTEGGCSTSSYNPRSCNVGWAVFGSC